MDFDRNDENYDVLKDLWGIIEEELGSRNNEDYEPVPEQMEKFVRAYSFFWKYTKENGGKILELSYEPKLETVGITVEGYFLYFNGEQLEMLSEIIRDMSALSIDAKTDGAVNFSFNIPGVFRHK